MDGQGNPVIDKATGKAKQRIASKTVMANIYTDYIWDDETKKFKGINKVDQKTEVWKYDTKGNRITEERLGKLSRA